MLFLYLQNTKQTKVTLSTKQTEVNEIKLVRKWASLETNVFVLSCMIEKERVWKWCLLSCVCMTRKRGGGGGECQRRFGFITILITLTTSEQKKKRRENSRIFRWRMTLVNVLANESARMVCMYECAMVNELILLQ